MLPETIVPILFIHWGTM